MSKENKRKKDEMGFSLDSLGRRDCRCNNLLAPELLDLFRLSLHLNLCGFEEAGDVFRQCDILFLELLIFL